MTEVLVAAVVAVIVSLLLGLWSKGGGEGFAEELKVASAAIVFYQVSGVLKAKVFPYRLLAGKKWDLEWNILDLTGTVNDNDVAVYWTAQDPTENKGTEKKRIKKKVKGDAAKGTYPYEIRVGASPIADPDLEIVM